MLKEANKPEEHHCDIHPHKTVDGYGDCLIELGLFELTEEHYNGYNKLENHIKV